MKADKNTKMVIVVRKFPNLRTGKYCSQVAHASMAFLTKDMNFLSDVDYTENIMYGDITFGRHSPEIVHWLRNSFRKICVYVNSEEELLELHQKALDKGLISHIVEDNGLTEFNGVKTLTSLAIGPAWDEKFIGITDQLPLL